MHPKTVYVRVQDCDKALKTLRGSGFEYMAQVKREERSRWIHELHRQSSQGVAEATKFLKMLKQL